MEQIREIKTVFYIHNDENGIALVEEPKIEYVLSKLKNNISYKIKKITSHSQRLHEIGEHLIVFKRITNDPLNFRNKIIKEWHELSDKVEYLAGKVNTSQTWQKISSKYGINCSPEKFSRWMFDLNEFSYK